MLTSNDEAEISLRVDDAIKKLDKVDAQATQEKKQIIIQLAKDLEGKIPTDSISIEIANHLRGRVSPRFIHNCLEEKYKQKHRVENARKQKKGQQEQEEGNENLAVISPLNQEVKKEEITIDVDGREERIVASPSEPLVDGNYSREDNDIVPSCHTQSTQTIVKTDNRECDNCKTLLQKIDELEEKVQHYEKIIEDTSIKTADQIISTETSNRETDQNGNSPISSSGNEIVDCEYSISWPIMQRYAQHIYKSGKPLRLWINFQLNKQTGTVVAAYLGRITERNRTDGEFGGVILENV